MTPPSRFRDLQFRLEYALLRLVAGGVRALPLDVATRVSARWWRRLAPHMLERERIALAHWENLGRVMAETMQLDRIISDPARIKLKNPQIFERYNGKLGPIVGVSLHMGNWELAIWPLTKAGAEPAAVYRSVNNPYVDQFLRDQRKELYPGGLFGRGRVEGDHGETQRTARAIMDYVRRGGRLGIVADLWDKTGMPLPFFGKDAATVTIPAMIARRTGGRIWMSRCVRVGTDSHFEIELKELRVPRTQNPSEDVKTATAAMNIQFEEWVRELPEQWMWSNRRWS